MSIPAPFFCPLVPETPNGKDAERSLLLPTHEVNRKGDKKITTHACVLPCWLMKSMTDKIRPLSGRGCGVLLGISCTSPSQDFASHTMQSVELLWWNWTQIFGISKQSRSLWLSTSWDGTGVSLCNVLKMSLVQCHCFVQIKALPAFGTKIFTLGNACCLTR